MSDGAEAVGMAVVGLLAGLLVVIGMATISAVPVYLCWNWALVSAVTFAHPISIFQAFGIGVLLSTGRASK